MSDGHPTEQLVGPCTDAVLLLTQMHLAVVNAQMQMLLELQLRGKRISEATAMPFSAMYLKLPCHTAVTIQPCSSATASCHFRP